MVTPTENRAKSGDSPKIDAIHGGVRTCGGNPLSRSTELPMKIPKEIQLITSAGITLASAFPRRVLGRRWGLPKVARGCFVPSRRTVIPWLSYCTSEGR